MPGPVTRVCRSHERCGPQALEQFQCALSIAEYVVGQHGPQVVDVSFHLASLGHFYRKEGRVAEAPALCHIECCPLSLPCRPSLASSAHSMLQSAASGACM